MTLVLASASPRRADLLQAAGYDFIVDPADVDEERLVGEPPARYVERIARAKAERVRMRHAQDLVLAADTTVVIDGEGLGSDDGDVLGKPIDADDAVRMLRRLSGRAHAVLTGVSIVSPHGLDTFVETTRVWFAELSEAEISLYVDSGEPMDKAGAYAIQGLASRFVRRIDGSYTNVVGLPVAQVHERLRALVKGT